MAKISPLMIAPPAIFAGLAALFFIGMNRENPDELPSMLIGKPAPTVEGLQPLSGTPLLTDEVLQGPGIKLVNFWGTWCVACRAEHPTLLVIEDILPVTLHGVNSTTPRPRPRNTLPKTATRYHARRGDDDAHQD